ncbi:MAG TPA: hypothetical protein VLL27_11910 [Solirubrobacterales bacterium]|nr:hypothetical protein [Solirubrobacterales bacterium]
MFNYKVLIALCTVSALLISAFAAQSATALGTKAFTCLSVSPAAGTQGFARSHCKPSDAVPTDAEFEHFSFPKGLKTEINLRDFTTAGARSGAVLKSTVAGSAIELVAEEVNGTGSMENGEVGSESIASGEATVTYSGITEKLLGCKVTGKPGGAGVVETKQLVGTTQAVGDRLKITPKEGTVFAEFELTECSVGPTTVKVVGSVLGVPDGATVNTSHLDVTTEKSLRLGSALGPIAGLAVTWTISGRTAAGSSYAPLSPTTQ